MILNKEADTKVGIPTERNQPSQLFETRHQEYLSRPESDQPFFEENQVENASPVSSGSVNEATNSVGGIFNSLLSLQCAGSDENQGSSSVGGSPDDTARGGSCRLGLGGAHSVQLCGGCGDAIVDKYLMNVLDKAWHASCVRCCDCNSPLTDKCYSRDGRLFCKEDFFRRFSTKCFGCNEPIMPKELLRKVRKHYFHLGCFVCSLCSKQLATGDELYVTPDNKLICRQDFLTASSTSVSSTSATLSLSLSPSSPPELTGDQENQTRKEAETCSSISEYPNQTFQDSNTTQKLEKTPPVKLEGPNSDLSLESKQQCEFEQNDTFPQNSLPFCQSFMKEKPVSKAACNFKSSDKSSVTGDDKGKCCEAVLKSDLFKNDSSNCEIMHQNVGGESNGVLEDYTSDTGGFNSDDDEKMFDDQDEGADLSDDNKSDFDESEFKNCGSPNKMNGETEDEIIGNPKTKSQVGSKRRGPRTTIKAKQLETLKSAFAATPKPTRHIREQLAQETGLNMRVIQVWFQNRRSKERRMKQLSALGARRAAFFQRRIRGPFEGPHNPDFLPGQIPFFGPQDLGNPDFFPMGQQFSYDFFPGVHQLGQPPTPLGVDNNEFPMPGNLPTPSSVMDPLRLHPDQLGVGMGGPFIPTSAPPPPLGSNNPVPISSAEEALAAMNSSQTGNHRLVLPSPDLNLPPSDRFLSSLTKPRFRHVFEDSPAPVW